MFKKIISVLLALSIVMGCFSMAVNARQVGVGNGAESFNPVEFYQAGDDVGDIYVNTYLVAKITDPNYKVRVKGISAVMPYYTENSTKTLDVTYGSETIVTEETRFYVSGTIESTTNSVVRYTVTYDILNESGEIIWKNLTGYAYGKVAGSNPVTGAVGTEPDNPGKLDDGAYFTSIDKLNSCYIQVGSKAFTYELKTQHFFITFRSRTTETAVVSGNAPSTIRFYPVDWPTVQWYRQENSGTWMMWSTPDSGYYNFKIDMNVNNETWEDQSNTELNTEMYYLDDWDRTSALNTAEYPLALNGKFSDGYYVQKGKYTDESWNNFITALDMAYQVAYAVPGANYGFKLACINGKNADDALTAAFANLQEAPCNWTTYKDPVQGEAATCGSGGTQIYTCICGKTRVEGTSTSSCTPSGEWVVTLEPTCTTTGESAQLCTMCSNPAIREEIEALGHEYTSAEVSPECLEEGYTLYTCIRGDHSYKDNFVSETGHTPGRIEKNYPTATRDGLKTVYCADCDAVVSTEAMPKPVGNFVFTLQSNDNTFFTSVTDADFETTFTVPKESVVNTIGVGTSISISDIPSLGVEDAITYDGALSAETGKEINLDDYMPLLQSASVSGKVQSRDSLGNIETQEYKYNLNNQDSEENYVVEAVPENAEDASAAFEAIVSHLTAEKIKEDEENEEGFEEITNYAQFPGTAYIQIGTEKLTFENSEETYLFSESSEKPALILEEAEAIEDVQIQMFIPVGTVFAIGNLKITFNDFATINLSGCAVSEKIDTILSTISSCKSNDEVIEAVVLSALEFVSSMNGNEIILDVLFAPPGYVLSGTVESFKPYDEADGTEITTVELMQDGKTLEIAMVEGEGVKDFAFESVANGTYTIRVMKINHVTREYEITVNASEMTNMELKIHLIGDINGDGKVNTIDTAQVNAHAKKVKQLEDYAMLCADVSGDDRVNTIDVAMINAHAKQVSFLW